MVRDHIPLEQGLRPVAVTSSEFVSPSQRPYSIRTRIKTQHYPDFIYQPDCQRPYSIRTRIKTTHRQTRERARHVRDHIPLEQGLRPLPFLSLTVSTSVRDHIPLEQGLRLDVGDLGFVIESQRPYSIRTRIKTLHSHNFHLSRLSQRPYSIRTRIKTFLVQSIKNLFVSETIFH